MIGRTTPPDLLILLAAPLMLAKLAVIVLGTLLLGVASPRRYNARSLQLKQVLVIDQATG